MKDLMGRINSFVLFENPSQTGYIKTLFIGTQNQYQQDIQGWEASSTRQQLIARYWFTDVKVHFAAVIGLPLLLLWPACIRDFSARLSGCHVRRVAHKLRGAAFAAAGESTASFVMQPLARLHHINIKKL